MIYYFFQKAFVLNYVHIYIDSFAPFEMNLNL